MNDSPILLCFNTRRDHFRDVIIGRHELYCAPGITPQHELQRESPRGEFDLEEFLATLPAEFQSPALFVARVDAAMSSVPRNLDTLKCPKVLIVGDTHHQGAAITRIVNYARSEKFDLIISEFNRQHLHFFIEAGVGRVEWLPCFSLSPFERPPSVTHSIPLGFFGSSGEFHPHRRAVLETLLQRGFPLTAKRLASREVTSKRQSETLINLNISLNGDLNLRIFETLSSGGFLITDRLAPESGLSALFEDAKHLVQFDDLEHLCQLTRHYLEHPADAQQIATAGHAEYLRSHRPEEKIRQLFSLLRGEAPAAQYDIRSDARLQLAQQSFEQLLERISIYETLQEWHRINLAVNVLFWNTERNACDAIDLPRLRTVMPPTAKASVPADIANRIKWLDHEEQELPLRCNVLVCKKSALIDAPTLRSNAFDRILTTDG